MNRSIVLGIVCVAFLLIAQLYGNESSSIEIRVSSFNKSYTPHEQVIIEFSLKNNTNVVQLIPPIGSLSEKFLILNDSGEPVHQQMYSTYVGYDSLMPNEVMELKADVSLPFNLTKPGKYICQLHIYGYNSNQIELNITEPTGIARKAWELFKKAQLLDYGPSGQNNENYITAYSTYLDVVEKYPETIYAPLSLRRAFFIYKLADRKTVQDKAKDYIEAGVNGELLELCLEAIVATSIKMNEREGGVEYLQKLINKHNGSIIGQRALFWQSKLQNVSQSKK